MAQTKQYGPAAMSLQLEAASGVSQRTIGVLKVALSVAVSVATMLFEVIGVLVWICIIVTLKLTSMPPVVQWLSTRRVAAGLETAEQQAYSNDDSIDFSEYRRLDPSKPGDAARMKELEMAYNKLNEELNFSILLETTLETSLQLVVVNLNDYYLGKVNVDRSWGFDNLLFVMTVMSSIVFMVNTLWRLIYPAVNGRRSRAQNEAEGDSTVHRSWLQAPVFLPPIQSTIDEPKSKDE